MPAEFFWKIIVIKYRMLFLLWNLTYKPSGPLVAHEGLSFKCSLCIPWVAANQMSFKASTAFVICPNSVNGFNSLRGCSWLHVPFMLFSGWFLHHVLQSNLNISLKYLLSFSSSVLLLSFGIHKKCFYFVTTRFKWCIRCHVTSRIFLVESGRLLRVVWVTLRV